MSQQTDTIDAGSVDRRVLRAKEGPSRFPGTDEEFYPRDVSALNIIEPVYCQGGWTAPKRAETRLECGWLTVCNKQRLLQITTALL